MVSFVNKHNTFVFESPEIDPMEVHSILPMEVNSIKALNSVV